MFPRREYKERLTILFLSRGLIADTEKRISDLSGKAAETYFDGTSNLRIVRAFGMEEAECRRYALQKSAFHLEQYVRDWTLFKRDSSIKSIHSIAKALVIGYAAYEIHNGRLTVGGMMYVLNPFYPFPSLTSTMQGCFCPIYR